MKNCVKRSEQKLKKITGHKSLSTVDTHIGWQKEKSYFDKRASIKF